jgi:ketosteroid isomerase-like protein
MNKTVWRILLAAGLLAGGLWACTATAADAERGALEAAIHRWLAAVNAQDVTTLTSTMTGDVELLEDGATVQGREAAIRSLRQGATHGQLIATSAEISMAGDVAWHIVGLAQRQANGDVQAHGQALEIWKRVDGEWKLHRRLATGATPAGISLTRPPAKEPVLDRPAS